MSSWRLIQKMNYKINCGEKVIIVRYGEIMLKGLNRSSFENLLIENIKKALFTLGKAEIIKARGRIYIKFNNENNEYKYFDAIDRLRKVFGIISVSLGTCVNNDFEEIKKFSSNITKEMLDKGIGKTFKVETKRGNKNFYMDSQEINRKLGEYLLSLFPILKVDVINPSFTIYVEVREFTYIYTDIVKAYGGLPVGSSGKATLLLSGGIDSPVAGWMTAKRGAKLDAVHFYSYPYTSERSKEKVIELTKILSLYCQNINLYIVPFTNAQLEIKEKCPIDLMTIIMRRLMMKICVKIAEINDSMALITGESLGQVASQTMQSLAVINAAVNFLILRPLIGMDKNEVINIAREIGTYETSILPYDDCCTLFVAKHPETKPKLEHVLISESVLNEDKLINESISSIEIINF